VDGRHWRCATDGSTGSQIKFLPALPHTGWQLALRKLGDEITITPANKMRPQTESEWTREEDEDFRRSDSDCPSHRSGSFVTLLLDEAIKGIDAIVGFAATEDF
jgi:hypothetical protein